MKPILINLDLKNNSYEEIELKQGCQDTLIATITDLGEVCDLTGQVLSVEMLKADNTFIIQSTDITVLNNKVTVTLNKDLTRVAGKGKLQIRMTKNGVVSGSWVVDVKIRKGAIDGNIGESGNIVTIKEELDKSIIEAKSENDKTQELIQGGGAATKVELAKTNTSLEENTNFTKKIIKAKNNTPTLINDTINQMTNNSNSVINFNSVNGIIELEAGVYEIDTIIMRSNITIKGQGIGKTIIKPVFSNIDKYIFDVLGTDTNNRLVNFELKDLSIMPNPSFQYAIAIETNRYLASGVNLSYCSSCRLTNVIISGFKGIGINQVENYDCNIDNLQMLGCGDSTHNSITFLNGISDGCNAIHLNGYRVEGCSDILFNCTSSKLQREIQFGIGKLEETGITIKGTSNINFIGLHSTWNKTTFMIKGVTSVATEIYGVKFVGCSFLSNGGYLCNNLCDGYIRFSSCNIKGFEKSFEGDRVDIIDNEIYSCSTPVVNLSTSNKIALNKFLATRGTANIINITGSLNIISENENIAPITTLGINVNGGSGNEILFNRGFNSKVTGNASWEASNNYQTTNGIRVTHAPSAFIGAMKFDVNTKEFSIYDGTTYRIVQYKP